ncbi:shootin-1 isoform X2 [Triplophysa rosa]|uniref:Shootin-1 n=2 Tax=Triplophysa rosa TaxID=992332 RepID=A0A9W7X5P6_TRIRA|nr:shootin-1 isoform X2 [Triplophysa rosa]KAI7814128.1 putative shootin-1 [Triplophysa rosa]
MSDSEDESISEDERDIQCEILEKERDDANEKLSMMGKASSQLLKELDMLEMQFQIERSCRETAEAFALKVSKDFKVLKRKSQTILPLIPEMPENLSVLNLDLKTDPDSDSEPGPDEDPLLKSQNQLKELQSSVDRLLGEKIQLCEQVELLKKEKEDLKEKLLLEVGEKEALVKKLSKHNRTVNKMKRVSQLVTEEFAEMSHKLEMEQGLRQHAEVFAHQMLVKQRETERQTLTLVQNAETERQLQHALNQVSGIGKTLEEIRLCFQTQLKQSQTAAEELNTLSDLAAARTKLEISEEERSNLETQLKDSQQSLTELQEEIKQLQDKLRKTEELSSLKSDQSKEENENPVGPPSLSPPPPPPPPPPPSLTVTDPLKVLRDKKKVGDATETAKPKMIENMKFRAVDEMMERIKKGIILRPILKPAQGGSEDENAWKEQRSENRKSAVLELQGMLDSMRRSGPRRGESKKRFSRNIAEAELQMVLQRRRRAIGDDKGTPSAPPKPKESPAAISSPWTGESGSAPVLRRLQQNREKRASRIKASESIIWEDK